MARFGIYTLLFVALCAAFCQADPLKLSTLNGQLKPPIGLESCYALCPNNYSSCPAVCERRTVQNSSCCGFHTCQAWRCSGGRWICSKQCKKSNGFGSGGISNSGFSNSFSSASNSFRGSASNSRRNTFSSRRRF